MPIGNQRNDQQQNNQGNQQPNINSSFGNLYQQILQHNLNGGQGQLNLNFPGQQQPSGFNSVANWRQQQQAYQQQQQQLQQMQQQEQANERRQASFLEKMAAGAGTFGEALYDAFTPFKEEDASSPLGIAGNVVGSVVSSTVAAPFTGAASLFEAATGSDLSSIDNEDNTISSESLTANQRFGALGSGAIDALGMFAGGSGRLIGSGFNAARNASRAARGLDKAEPVLEGWAKKAGFGKPFQIASDSFEEGAEEFAQSIFDDVRDENVDEGTLGRALYAGGIGAIAGGAMSGAAHGVNALGNYAYNRLNPQQAQDQALANQSPSITEDPAFDAISTMHYVPSAQQALSEQRAASTTQPGSGMFRNMGSIENGMPVGFDRRSNVNESALGTQTLQSMWNANKPNATREMMARAFHTDVETLGSMLNSSNATEQINSYISNLLNQGIDVTMVVGRYPATNPTVTFKQNLVGVFNGTGYKGSPLVYTQVNMDNDGDISPVFFSEERLNDAFFPTQRLVNISPNYGTNQAGASYLSFNDYSGISGELDIDTIRNAVIDSLGPIDSNAKNSNGINIADQITEELSQAFLGNKIDDRIMASALESALTQINTYISQLDPNEAMSYTEGYKVIGNILQNLEQSNENYLVSIAKNAEDITAQTIDTIVDTVMSQSNMQNIEGRGTTDGFINLFKNFAWLTYCREEEANALFRQDGRIGLWSKRVQHYQKLINDSAVSLFNESGNFESAFDTLIRIQMRVNSMGEHPANSIDGIVNNLILQEITSKNIVVRNNEDLNNLLSVFIESYNKYAKIIKSARESIGAGAEPFITNRSEIDGLKDDSLYSKFLDTIIDLPITDILDVRGNQLLSTGISFKDYFRMMQLNYNASRDAIDANDAFLNTTMRKLQKAYNSRTAKINTSLVEYFKNLAGSDGTSKNFILRTTINNMVEGNIDSKDLVSITDYVESLFRVLPAKNIIDYDPLLGSPEYFVNTKYAKAMLKDGGDGKMIASAVASLSMDAKYADIRNAYEQWNNETDPDLKEKWWHVYTGEVGNIVGTSRLDEEICRILFEKPESGIQFLNLATDLEMDADEKQWKLADALQDPTIDYLVDSLTFGTEEFAVSSISSRIVSARSALREAYVSSYVERMNNVKALLNTFESSVPSHLAHSVLHDMYIDTSQQISGRAIGMAMYDATSISNSNIEKNTTVDSSSVNHRSLSLAYNGAIYSVLDEVAGANFGIMPLSDFVNNSKLVARCFFDDNFQMEVWDNGKRLTITRQKLFEYCGAEYTPGPATLDQIKPVLETFPAILDCIRPLREDVSLINSEYTVELNPYEDIESSIRKYALAYENINDASNDRYMATRISQYRNVARLAVANNTLIAPLVVRAYSAKHGGHFDEHVNAEEMVKASEEILNNYTNYILKSAIEGGGKNAKLEAANRKTRFLHNIVNDVVKAISYSRQISELRFGADYQSQVRMLTDSTLQSLTDASYRDIARTILDQQNAVGISDLKSKSILDFEIDVDSLAESKITEYKLYAGLSYLTSMIESRNGALFAPTDIALFNIESMIDNLKEFTDFNGNHHKLGDEGYLSNLNAFKADVVEQTKRRFADSYATSQNLFGFDVTGELITMDDVANADIGAIEEKIANICKMTDQKAPKREDIAKAITSNNPMNFVIKWNSFWADGQSQVLGRETGWWVNGNAINAYNDYIAKEDALIETVRDQLRESGLPLDGTILNLDMFKNVAEPELNFSDIATEAAANRMANYYNEGAITLNIGLNGSMANKMSGFGWIPNDAYCGVPPKEIPYDSIVQNGLLNDEYRDWHYIIPGEGFDLSDRSTFNLGNLTTDSIQSGALQPNENGTVLLFDPKDCSTGVCSCHSKGPVVANSNPAYSLFRVFIARFNDYAQEDYTLQIKKKFNSKNNIVNVVKVNNILQQNKVNSNIAGNELNVVRDVLNNARTEIQSHWENIFTSNDDFRKLGYNNYHANIFAQIMTPGIILKTSNGNSVVINSDIVLSNEQTLIETLQQIVDNGNDSIISAEPIIVTFEETSDKINRAVSELQWREKDNITQDQIANTAMKALIDWSDYGFESLDMAEVFDAIPAKTYATPNYYRAQSSPTPLMNFTDIMYRMETGASRTDSHPKYFNGHEVNLITDQGKIRLIDSINERFGSKHFAGNNFANWFSDNPSDPNTYHLVQSFGSIDLIEQAYNDLGFKGLQKDLSTIKENEYYNNGKSAGIVFNKDGLKDAIDWARKYDRAVFVRSEEANTTELRGMKLVASYVPVGNYVNNNGMRSGVPFNIYQPIPDYVINSVKKNTARSKRMYIDLNTIMGRLLTNLPGKFNMADGETIMSRSTASSFVINGHNEIRLDYSHALTSGMPVRLATIQDLDENLGSALADGNIDLTNVARDNNMNQEYLDNKIQEYKDWYVNSTADSSDGRNTIRSSNIHRDDVVAFLAQDQQDGTTKLWPVIAPKTGTWDIMDNIYIQKTNGKFYFNWSSMRTVGEDPSMVEGFKSASYNMSDKTTVTVVDDNILPGFAKDAEGKTIRINAVSSINTSSSRLYEIEPRFFMGNLYYYTTKFGRSLFYEKDQNGNWIRNQWLAGTVDESGNYIPGELDRAGFSFDELVSMQPAVRDAIADGRLRLVENDEVNKIIRNMVSTMPDRTFPWNLLFNNIQPTEGTSNNTILPMDLSWEMAIGNIGLDNALKFFNAFDDSLCPYGIDAEMRADNPTKFNKEGKFLLDLSAFGEGMQDNLFNGTMGYMLVDWSPQESIGKYTIETAPSSSASFGDQAIMRKGMELSFYNTDWKEALDMSTMATNSLQYAMQKNIPVTLEEYNSREYSINDLNYKDYIGELERYNPISLSDAERERKVDSIADTFKRSNRLSLIDSKNETIEWRDIKKNPEIAGAINRLQKVLGKTTDGSEDINEGLLYQLYCLQTSTCYIEGSENPDIRAKWLAKACNEMANNIEKRNGKNILVITANNIASDRIAIPLLPPSVNEYLWRYDKIKKSWNNDYDAYIKAQKEETDIALQNVFNITKENRKEQIRMMFDWAGKNYGLHNISGYVSRGYYITDIENNTNEFIEALVGSFITKEEYSVYKEGMERTKKMREREIKRIQYENTNVSKSQNGNGYDKRFNNQKTRLNRFMDNLVSLSIINRLANLEIFPAAVIDLTVTQKMGLAFRWVARKGLPSPYKSNYYLDDATMASIGSSSTDVNFFRDIKEMGYTQDLQNAIAAGLNPTEIIERRGALKERKKNLKWFSEKVFFMSSGGQIGIKNQMRLFAQDYARRLSAAGFNHWFDPVTITDVNGESYESNRYSEMIKNGDLASIITESLSGPEAELCLSALNQSRAGEMAQNTVPSMIFDSFCQRHPSFNFFSRTVFSPFFRYSMNITGRFAQTFMPTSSLHYMLSDMLQKTKLGERLNFEANQLNTSLKEAIMEDAMVMTASQLGFILAAAAGLFQPPEDDDKKNNILEYTFCGFRIGENWWLQDTLGMIAPFACFWTNVLNDEPRMDVLVNGIMEACYSNPVFRMSDIANNILNPEDSVFQDYEQDKLMYEQTAGGAPSPITWAFTNARNYVLNWSSQFYLPSFLKELYRTWDPYEHTYRRVYETENGRLTEAGEAGKTVLANYDEAMLRQVTRRNPFLGFLCDMFIENPTGYMNYEMPRSVFYDDYQRASIEYFSLSDSDGNPLPIQEQESRIMEATILLKESSIEDLEELYHAGFYLPYETRAAISQNVWDTIQSLTDMYTDMEQAGYLSYSSDAWGDWDTGQIMVSKIKETYYNEINMWKDFYYDKLCSEWVNAPRQTYNRYNTTYAEDVNGNIYATGYYNNTMSNFMPFITAPGTLEDPANTAGWSGDWNSLSAVAVDENGNPAPLNSRALIPTDNKYDSWPSLEYWSGDGEGNGYSSRYTTNGYSENGYPATVDTSTPTGLIDWSSAGGRYPASTYYSSRRSGGGGGGTPSLYSRLPNINMASPRTMNTTRGYNPNFDYLRPGFETKGSRESYKRNDI